MNTTSLKYLYMRENLLTSLPPIMEVCDSLQVLNVAYNDIQVIPDDYFASCSKMTDLNICSNKLTTIDYDTFVGLISISILHLGDNMIGDITGDLILNHPALRYLHLNKNKLTQLPSLVTNGTSELIYLNVAHNNIKNVSENQVRHLQKLSTLDVRNNLLTEITFILTLPNLQQIHLGDNPIPFTENLFDDMRHLANVELRDSGLVSFPLLSASKNSLTTIQLSKNQIRCVDVLHLTNMTNLQNLFISFNDIKQFPDYGCKEGNGSASALHALQFPSLGRLDINNNKLTGLTRDILSKMPELYYLVASHNEIIDMPFLSSLGASLKYAYLGNNNISHIESKQIAGLSSLEWLDLSDNSIAYLNLNILLNLANLRLLNMRNNKLTTPPMAMTNNLTLSMNIKLQNNPYICDSRVLAGVVIDGLLCNTPLKFAGQTIEHAREAIIRGKYTPIMCLA